MNRYRIVYGRDELLSLPNLAVLREIGTGVIYQLAHSTNADVPKPHLIPRLMSFGTEAVFNIPESTRFELIYPTEGN